MPVIVDTPAMEALAKRMAMEAMAKRKAANPKWKPIKQRNPISYSPFQVYYHMLMSFLEDMEEEICANWREKAKDLTKSAFVNYLLLSLTNRNWMWKKDGIFSKSATKWKKEAMNLTSELVVL
jgi:hypothetical protein